eukprot:gene5525-11134_t
MSQLDVAERSYIFEERIEEAERLKEQGNLAFHSGDLDGAIKLYEQSLYHSDFDEAQMNLELMDVHVQRVYSARDPVYLNIARLQLKREQPKQIIENVTKVLRVDTPKDRISKARYLLGRAYLLLRDYDRAVTELSLCATSTCNNSETDPLVNKYLKIARSGVARERSEQTTTWGGIILKQKQEQQKQKQTEQQLSQSQTDGTKQLPLPLASESATTFLSTSVENTSSNNNNNNSISHVIVSSTSTSSSIKSTYISTILMFTGLVVLILAVIFYDRS